MSDRIKEVIVKVGLSLSFGSMIFAVVGPFFYVWFLSEEVGERIFFISYVVFFATGIIMMILIPLLGIQFSQKPTKAEKYELLFDDFDSLSNYVSKTTEKNGYFIQSSEQVSSNCFFKIYMKARGLWIDNCIVLFSIEELSSDTIDNVNKLISKSLIDYYKSERITNTVNIIGILCVQRITPAFRNFVNGNVFQELKIRRLPVGVSFGGKSIYVANQKGGFAIAAYKKLKKELIKIIPLKKRMTGEHNNN
mgnify:CR=1 FL=1